MLGFEALGRYALGQFTSTAAFSVTASAGSFTLTGVAAGVTAQRYLSAGAGSFTLAGPTTRFPLVMPADVGAFTLTGIAATPTAVRRIVSAVGSFALSGQEITPKVTMPAGVGAYSLTGISSVLVQGYVLNAEPYVATERLHVGFAALGAISIGQMQVSTGFTFQIGAQDIAFRVNMPADVGAFVITLPSTVAFARTRPKIVAFPRVGRGAISAKSVGRDMRARSYGG